jgi:hypothetical protein
LLRDLLTEDYTAIRIDNGRNTAVVTLVGAPRQPAPTGEALHRTSIFEVWGAGGDRQGAPQQGVVEVRRTSSSTRPKRSSPSTSTPDATWAAHRPPEDTIVKTNLEAVKEIVRRIGCAISAESSCST